MKKLFVTLVIMAFAMPMMAQSLQKFIDKYSAISGVELVNLGPEMLKNGFSKSGINIGPIDKMPGMVRLDSINILTMEKAGKRVKKFVKDAKKLNIEADGYSEVINTISDGDYVRILARGEMADANEFVVIATDEEDESFTVVRMCGKMNLESLMNQ